MALSENVGSIAFDARIETDKLKKDAAEVDRLSKKAGDDLADHSERGSGRAGEALKNFGKIAAVALAAAGAAAIAFGVSSAKAFIESENAIAQTEAVLKSTNQVAGVTSKTVTDLANSLQRQTRYSDETIRSAENMLLTFTNIGKKTFPGATKAVLDMATAMGTDLQSTAIQVGKALQDPVRGATALQRVGVRLSESQKELIGKLVATGDAAGAQAIILKELQTEFGGSAEAAGKTFAGRLDILKNQLGEVQEGIGELIVRGLGPLVSNLLKAYDAAGGVDGILKTLGNTLRPVANDVIAVARQVGDYLVPKLIPLGQTIRNDLIPAVINFAKAVGPTAGAGLVAALGFAITSLNILLAALTPVINFMADHTIVVWALVGAFAAWRAALIISGAVSAFQAAMVLVRAETIATAGTMTAATGVASGLRLALARLIGPWQITLAIIGIEAVLWSINQIQGALEKMSRGFDDLSKKKINIGGRSVSGNSDIAIIQSIKAAFGFRAAGGPVTAGQPYIVGENQPELFVPRTSGTIIPEVPQGGNNSNITVNLNMTGIMARSKADERDIAKSLLARINEELTSKGVPVLGGGAI